MLLTKLHRPPCTPDLISREQLIAELTKHSHVPFILVSAPAGYGKSIALTQYLEQSPLRHTWLSLDQEHNDLRTFLRYWVASIKTIFPEKLPQITHLLNNPTLPPLEIISEGLINALDEITEEYIFVLDDYHVISNQQVHDLLNSLIEYPPEHMQLVLLTRRDPPLAMQQARIYGQLYELRMHHLSFTAEEVGQLYQILCGHCLPEAQTHKILERSEGWPIGVKMLVLNSSNRGSEFPRNLPQLTLSTLSNFIQEELLHYYSPDFQEILLITSTLHRFQADLIDTLLARRGGTNRLNGTEFLRELLHKNIFIISLDHQQQWYRYHHLFQQLLQHQLEKRYSPDEIDKLYLLASQWFEKQGLIDEAIEYATKAKVYHQAADIIEKHRFEKFNQDEWWVIQNWMDKIPENIVRQRSGLMLAQLFLLEDHYQYQEMLPIIDYLEKSLESQPESALIGELYFHKGFLSTWFYCNGKEAIQYFEESKKLLPDQNMLGARREFILAVARQMTGQLKFASEELEKLGSRPTNGELFNQRLLFSDGLIHLLSGKLTKANKIGRQLYYLTHQNEHTNIEAWGYYLLANVLFQSHQSEEAAVFYQQKCERLVGTLNYRVGVDAFSGLILSLAFQHKFNEAERAIQELAKRLDKIENSSFSTILRSTQARYHLIRGNTDLALDWARSYIRETQLAEIHMVVEVPVITKARILVAAGNNQDLLTTLPLLRELQSQLESIHNRYHLADLLVLQALALYKLKRYQESLPLLEEALTWAETEGWLRPLVESGIQLVGLLQLGLSQSHYPTLIKKIVAIIENENFNPQQAKVVPSRKDTEVRLSQREIEIIKLVKAGKRNKEIANQLGISTETVKSHLHNVFKKLKVKSRIEMLRQATQHDLLNSF